MAKRKKSRESAKSKKRAAPRAGRTIVRASYAGNKYDCYGKRVRAGRASTRVARVFCRKDRKGA